MPVRRRRSTGLTDRFKAETYDVFAEIAIPESSYLLKQITRIIGICF